MTRVRHCTAFVAILVALVVVPISATNEQSQKQPDNSQFAILGVVIGQDDLGTLEKKLGPSKRCHTKEHVSIVGYTSGEVDLVFEFSEVGGGDITGFYLDHASHLPNCSFSHLGTKVLATVGGTYLGMKEEAFLGAFGHPQVKNKQGEWSYHWTWKEKLTEAEKQKAEIATPGYAPSDGAIASVDVKARFSKGMLQYFYISKLEVT
ncbi:MAG TPA: hypothetical protein VKT53_09355 [Candidatus Acidoferrum sp.]|nr:hypothetical protein [Candidatus Acidoferrum sp.]